MKNKGFTLIELLAVIVILSLLALLAGTAVTKMIKDSKNDLYETQLLSIKSAAQAWGTENLMQIPDTGLCRYITLSDLKEAGILEEKITDPRTNKEISDSLIIKIQTTSNKYGKPVTTYEVDPEDLSGCLYMYDTICTAVNSATVTNGNIPKGSYVAGDEYVCKVNGNTSYHFYVLSTEGDTVNLISSTSIGSSNWMSTSDYTAAGGTNFTQYGEMADKGPLTVMNSLSQLTKDWSYIPNISINWNDDERGTYDGIESGYGGFSTSGNKVSIIARDGTVTATYENLKARLPNVTELSNLGCSKYGSNSCPTWLYNDDGTYWTASSAASGGSYNVAWAVYDYGFGFWGTYNTQNIRPVISLSKSDIKASQPICEAVTSETVTAGNVPSGSYTTGDEYICNVDGTNKYHFFVLGRIGSNVNLIMNSDIASDGTPSTTATVAWLSNSDYTSLGGADLSSDGANCQNIGVCATNEYGPVTAMNFLHNATKNWTNIPNITMNYTDEGGQYGGIKTSGTTTSITKTDGTVTATYENLKTRLPNLTEMSTICTGSGYTNCPSWVSVNSHYYWMSTSSSSYSSNSINYAYVYYSSPNQVYGGEYITNKSGYTRVRPVISIPIAELK